MLPIETIKRLVGGDHSLRQVLACRYFADTGSRDPDLIPLVIRSFAEHDLLPNAWDLRPFTRHFPVTAEAFLSLLRYAQSCHPDDREDAWEIIDSIPQDVASTLSDSQIRHLDRAGLDPECIRRFFRWRELESLPPPELEIQFADVADRTEDVGDEDAELELRDIAILLGRRDVHPERALERLLRRKDGLAIRDALGLWLAESRHAAAIPALVNEFSQPVRNDTDRDALFLLGRNLVRCHDPLVAELVLGRFATFTTEALPAGVELLANLVLPESETLLLELFDRPGAAPDVLHACALQFVAKFSDRGLRKILDLNKYRDIGMDSATLADFREALELCDLPAPRGFDTFIRKIEKLEHEEMVENQDHGWLENEEPDLGEDEDEDEALDDWGEDVVEPDIVPGSTDDLLGDSGDTYVRDEPKIGRNDPCPCGSGKKYKKCCGT